ncbi:transposase [Paenibacillus sp. CMAA1739]|uniref:transposase n=1 Tax=Paenibacillus ottowii TaxID=2315729 RepID=UPI00272FCE2D|nr:MULTISPECIES: transposase [Paenibacillus]MDP1512374.1 transposase [Paenibacillus ottowii]MEC4568343.1 transposase [Paenibacillus sp. CMAA1739]
MERKGKDLLPLTGEKVEVDGIYVDEDGHEQHLHRGQHFPADVVLGTSEWKMTEYAFDNHHEGRTDERLIPKEDDENKMGKITHPRRHLQRGDR